MRKAIFTLFLTVLFSCNSFASLLLTNQNQYLEINFSISSDTGVFDHNVNRFNLLPDFGEFSTVRNPVENYILFNGNTQLGESFYPGFVADDYNAGGIDFSSIRDGSIQGVIHFYAWDEDRPEKTFEFNNFGWSLDVCSSNGCNYAPSSFVSFGEIKVVSTAVSEPSLFILMFISLTFLIRIKSRTIFK